MGIAYLEVLKPGVPEPPSLPPKRIGWERGFGGRRMFDSFFLVYVKLSERLSSGTDGCFGRGFWAADEQG